MDTDRITVSRPSIALSYGGKWDGTKVVSPDVIQTPDARYAMYYVGTNCLPHERKGYRLLTCTSEDGVAFVKGQRPLLRQQSEDDKHYSPCMRQWNGAYLLFYGLGSRGKYAINIARSADGIHFAPDTKPVIDVGPLHQAAAHTPKVLIGAGNVLHCYYTGSHTADKAFSKKYPEYDFADNFRLFRATSNDAKRFSEPEAVTIEGVDFRNIYGHNVAVDDGVVFLVFTGFDGSLNRLYLTTSIDGLHFKKPTVLIEPEPAKQELGVYSASFLKSGAGEFRLYYGCRYFDNRWKILTRVFTLRPKTTGHYDGRD